MERVLHEFDTEKTVELNHNSGADFLVWNDPTEGVHHSISVGIPEAWLEDSNNGPKLEATTRNFAGYLASFILPPR
jgi:hypothetical protein